MINLMIKDGSNIEIKEESKNEKKYRIALIIAGLSIYTLAKLAIKHDIEIENLKKVIEGMQSKGE